MANLKNKTIQDFRAFTLSSTGILRALILDVGITMSIQGEEDTAAARLQQYKASINTSFFHSQISDKVINDLGLISKVGEQGEVWYVDLYLPNMIRIAHMPMEKCKKTVNSFDNQVIDCMIGMDVLSCGDVTMTGKDKQTIFSFRVPALGAEDFVVTHRRERASKKVTTSAVRNGPCPCGSGKKYKNCCGKLH